MILVIMQNFNQYNTPWYKTRKCAIPVILWSCADEIFTVLIQNKNHHRGWILPWGQIENKENSVTAALRKLQEELWRSDTKLLTHIGSLGTLYRTWWTDPHDEKEILLLSMKPKWSKFLFIKQQIYELFVINHESCDHKALLNNNIAIDIAAISTAMVHPQPQRSDMVVLSSDRTILQTITHYLDISGNNIDTISRDISSLQSQILLHHNTLFD